MTKVTVTIDTQSNARLFLEMLRALKFVKSVKTEKLPSSMDKTDIKILEERWKDYLKHPRDVQTWEEVKKELLVKHGR